MARTEDSHVAKQASQALPSGQGPAPESTDATLPEAYPAVVVRDESPAQVIASCTALGSANTTRPILPQDPRRRRAVILAVDNDVYLAGSLELAQAAEGGTASTLTFYLPKSIPLPVMSKGALFASATTTATASRISVLVEKDDD